MGIKNVLVVEDNKIIQLVNTEFFRKCGYNMIAAATGSEAIRVYFKTLKSGINFDLIILDLGLPDIDGYLLCEIFRLKQNADNLRTPILAYTAQEQPNQEAQENFIKLGFDELIVKGVGFDTFKQKINYWLAKSDLDVGDKQND